MSARSPKPNRIAFREIPAALRDIDDDRWCTWRWVWRDGKWTKPPLKADGSFGNTSEPATWCSLETAQAALANGHPVDGIGLNLKDLKGIAVIDLDDCRDPETGTAKPAAKELILKAQSYAEATPSGTGFRIIGTVPEDFRNIGTHRQIDDFKIEVYVNSLMGRYITVTGAHLEGVPDTLADISSLIEELTARKADGKANGAAEPDPEVEDFEAAAMDPVAAEAQLAHLAPEMAALIRDGVPEGRRSDQFFHVCGYLKDKGFTIEVGYSLLAAFPNGIAHKYAARGDLKAQVALCFDRAETKAKAETDKSVDIDPDMDPEKALAYLNEKHFIVREGSKVIVYSPRFDPVLKRAAIDGMIRPEFSALYHNRLVRLVGPDGKAKFERWGPWWLSHRKRRQYIGGVICDPTGKVATKDHYNLWQGFGVEPRAGDWTLMRKHIFEVVCRMDEEAFGYVMGWLAFLVQHPERLPETALVLCGGRGTGKGILGRAFLRLFGQHGIHISNAKHLVGNFNNHLRDAIFCFADEAIFAGDKQHESVLKALITEPTLGVEAKYRDRIEVPNMIHVLMASNEQWVAPAGPDERRFAIFRISDTRRGDHNYFKGIGEQMENGGSEAMLHDLLEYDLAGFQIRNAPQTEALMANKAETLTGSAAWLYDVLARGYLNGEPETTEGGARQPNRIDLYDESSNILNKDDCFHDFERNLRHYRVFAKPMSIFFRDLYKLGGGVLARPVRRTQCGKRVQSVAIPPLIEARRLFDEYMGGDIAWDDE